MKISSSTHCCLPPSCNVVIKDPLSSTSTPSRDDVISPTPTCSTTSIAAGTGDGNDGDHLDGQQCEETWEEWGEEWGEECDGEWGEEWDGEWGEEWGDQKNETWESEKEVDGEVMDQVELTAPEPKRLDFGQVDSVVPYMQETPEEEVSFAGLFWDPITCEQVELGTMTGHTLGDKGGWTAYYEGFDGHLYSLTRIEDGKGQPPESLASKVGEKKIQYEPLTKNGVVEFAEKAWPNSGDASGSGLQNLSPSASSNGGDTPNETALDREGLNYPMSSCQQRWVAVKMHDDLGTKPEGNESPLELSTVNGMTLTEHIQHVKWYASPFVFKSKIPNGISDQLWEELVEIFKIYHAYNISDPEIVLLLLREKWARESCGYKVHFVVFGDSC